MKPVTIVDRDGVRRPRLALALALIAAAGLWPADGRAAAGWTGPARIVELQVNYLGRILVRLDVESNPTDCKDKEWFYRDQIVGADLMYRMLLEAAVAGRPVRVYVTGLCDINRYSEISKVSLLP